MLPRPPTPTLFPYTTLFRSEPLKSFSASNGVSKSVCLLLVLGLFSYRGRELFFCWLYFSLAFGGLVMLVVCGILLYSIARRSEEHTSELQSQFHLVCRLLLE